MTTVMIGEAEEVFKRCGCGIAYTREGWEHLHFVGHYADDVETLEMRNCACGSTITINVPPLRDSTVHKTGAWVVVTKNESRLGDVVSVHRTRNAANRKARRVGGCVESAQVVALVQAGVTYTEAIQSMGGTAYREVSIEVPGHAAGQSGA